MLDLTATPFISRRNTITGLLTALILTPHPALAGIDVSGLRVEGSDSKSNIELAGATYTPAAMILQMAEQTASMEGMMRASASEMTTKSKPERILAGSKGLGPGVVAREDLVKSADVMITNSKIVTIAPAAAVTLAGVKRVANGGKGDMTKEEYLQVATQYSAAREDLRRAFETMTEEDQVKGKGIMRSMRAKDEERMRAMNK